jgi:hypothetical protein
MVVSLEPDNFARNFMNAIELRQQIIIATSVDERYHKAPKSVMVRCTPAHPIEHRVATKKANLGR